MTAANVEAVQRMVDAEDVAAVLPYMHPDVEWIPLRAATEGAYRGHEGIERFWADTDESFDVFEPHFELRDLGERVLASGTLHVRGRGSGLETDIPVGGLFDFRDGLIVRWQDFGSRQKALEVAFEALLSALNARDFDEVARMLGPGPGFKSLFAAAEGGEPFAGVEGMRRWAEEVDAVWDDWHQEVVEFREANDAQVVMVMHATGRAKASGVPLDTLTGNVLTWRDGEGWEMAAYADPREAFKAVGLPR